MAREGKVEGLKSLGDKDMHMEFEVKSFSSLRRISVCHSLLPKLAFSNGVTG